MNDDAASSCQPMDVNEPDSELTQATLTSNTITSLPPNHSSDAPPGVKHSSSTPLQSQETTDQSTSNVGSETIDGPTLLNAPTVGRGCGRSRSRGHGARGSHGGHVFVGEGVKRKAGSDVPGPNVKKSCTALPPPSPREMSKWCAFDPLLGDGLCLGLRPTHPPLW